MAPQVGLEPTTLRLTAECSAIELLRNMGSGGDLLSRTVTSQVPSALKGLTSVFGMGTGVTPSLSPPEMVSYVRNHFRDSFVPLSERWTRLAVLFFLLTGRWIAYATLTTAQLRSRNVDLFVCFPIGSRSYLKSSPRPISIIKLHTLPYFHR